MHQFSAGNTCAKLPIKLLKQYGKYCAEFIQSNPFLVNVSNLYPLQTPENLWLFGLFAGYKMETLDRNG